MVFISDVSRRRVHLPEHDANKPGRQIVTFLLICNITMWVIYTFDAQKVTANPVQVRSSLFLTLLYFFVIMLFSVQWLTMKKVMKHLAKFI